MSVKEYLALDKFSRFWSIIKHNGGVINSIKKIFRLEF